MATLTPAAVTPVAPPSWPAPAPAPTRPAPGVLPALSFTDIIRVLRQKIFVVLFVWLFGIVVTVATTAIIQRYYPLYTADSFVHIKSLNAPDPEKPYKPTEVRPDEIERWVLDQSYLATSPGVLEETLRDPVVRATRWFKDAEEEFRKDPTEPLDEQLKDALTVTPIRRSSLLQVSASVPYSTDARDIVNVLIAKYIDAADQMSKSNYQAEEANLRNRRNAKRTEKDAKFKQMNDLLARYPVIATALRGEKTAIDEDVLFYNALKNDFATQAINYKNEWEMIEDFGVENMPVTDEILAAVEQDQLIIDYKMRLSRLEEARISLLERLGPNHRQVREVESAVADMQQKLGIARIEAQNRLMLRVQQEARRAYSSAQQTLVRLTELYDEAVARQTDQQEKFKLYKDYQIEYQLLSDAADELTRNLDQLSSIANRARSVQVSQLSKAVEPKKRSRPKWALYLPVGIGLSLMVAIGLALALEFTDTSVRTPRDLMRYVEMSVLGVIPSAEDDEVDIDKIELATMHVPNSVTAEAFRQMRTNLFFAAPPERQGTIVITSPSPGEGKTTVAINLAAALAMNGRRVLLVDANFRRPTLRSFFPDLKPDGFSNLLVGQGQLSELVCPSGVAGMDVLSTGPVPPNPAELLGSGYLRTMIAEARGKYDQVIFDGPPLLLVSDALVMSAAADGVIVVCRFRQTSRGTLQRARYQLEGLNVPVLGAVLNAVQSTRGGYFRKQYRAFYDYQAEGEPAVGETALPGEAGGDQPSLDAHAANGFAPDDDQPRSGTI